MPISRRTTSPLRLLVALAASAGCASTQLPGTRIETQAVSVAETHAPSGLELPPQPAAAEPSGGEVLLQAMSRMVANDGALRPLAWQGVPLRGALGCQVRYLDAPGDALYVGSAYQALDPYTGLRWRDADRIGLGVGVGVGVSLGDGEAYPLLFASPCRGDLLDADPASRVARLAPELTGRDTSHLFSTARAATGIGRGLGGIGQAGVLLGVAMPQGTNTTATDGRSAKPRGSGAPGADAAPAPTAAPAGAAASSKAEAPKGDAPADDRRGGGFLGSLVKAVTSAGGARAH